jgi:hypothetical protein
VIAKITADVTSIDTGNGLIKLCAAVGYNYAPKNHNNSSAVANYTQVATIPNPTNSSAPNSTNEVALGVGLGVGLPLMAAIGALVGFFLFRMRERRISNPGGLAYEPQMVAQHSTIPYELDARKKLQELETRPEELE